MENLSHLRQPSKSAASFSKKACNGGSFIPKTTYDDVFGGQPKFGAPTLAPRVEDYTEIFGGFHAPRVSSIPVLDLPVADEEDVFFDVRSSGFDYDDVFGGFDGLDGAVSVEELMVEQSNGVNTDVDSCEETWTPAETESLSGESNHSGKNQNLSNGDPYESIDGSTEFNISYHKANQRSDADMSNGITHVAQLHSVPGFTFLIDKSTPLEKAYYENPPLEVTDDSNFHMDFGAGVTRERNLKKTLSQPSNFSSGEQTFSIGLKPQREYGRNNSLPNEMFVTVSEISLRTHPTEVPPPCRPAPLLDVKKGDSAKLAKNSEVTASEGIVGDTSPPFYDVEVDASSSAAASAAAMKEVMEKAQAKLKTAKALLERKREGVESRKHDRKDKERKAYRIVDSSNTLKEEHVQENGLESSVTEERQNVNITMKAVPDSLEEQQSFNMDKLLAQKHGRSDKIDGVGQWKEETQFFELVKTDRSTFEQTKYDEVLVPDTKQLECRQKIKKGAMEAVEHQQRKVKETCRDPELGENEKYLKVATEDSDWQGSNGRSGASKATSKHKGEKRVKLAQEITEQVKDEKKLRMRQVSVEIEKKPTGADEPEMHENLVKVQHKESRCEGEKARKRKENEQPLKETNGSMESESRFKGSCERAVQGRKERDAFEQEENEKKIKADLEQVENEKKVKDTLEHKDKDRRLRKVPKQEDNEQKLDEVHEREKSEKSIKEVLEQMGNEKKQREAFEREDNERRLKQAFELEENEKRKTEARETEENQKRVDKALEKEEHERREKEGSNGEETAKRLKEACEIEKMEKRIKEAHEKEETGRALGQVCEKEDRGNMPKEKWVETENWLKDSGEAEDLKELNKAHEQTRWDEYGKKLKQAEGPHMFKEGEDLTMSDKAFKLDEDDNENSKVNRFAGQHEDNGKRGPVTQGTFLYEENRKVETEHRDDEMVAEAVETTKVPVDRKFEVSGMAPGNLECEDYRTFAEPLCNDHNVKRTGESGRGIEQVKTKSALQMDSDAKNQGKKYADEWGEGENKIKPTQVGLNQEDSKDKFIPTQLLKESIPHGRYAEAAQPSVLEGKRNIQQTAQSVNASQSSDKKESNIGEMRTSEEKEAERMKRERELENERLMRLEEEREREREREKDRMAVDITTLEAREKTYAEVRERAERSAVERATAEARQRALAEARERLEKACAEAKEKSLAEKASMEARLRAERAAVERATAEARERAVEKAMAEKAAFETRERVDRTFSEKFSASSRNSTMRPSSSSSDLQDQKFQSASSLSGLRYPYSSGYSASYNTERYEGVEGESAQRCKARLERHQRTAERAAKALAEKNMRDLLAQREQAERNRLAETLDADVKRWSSGKEGNLRALLSTLQYILGPDSGWHPIPLTEVITSAAVKKAYRKATLCVHPDKLQQRGASIQQKYICEKVFDLLKEAWNKFNSEER